MLEKEKHIYKKKYIFIFIWMDMARRAVLGDLWWREPRNNPPEHSQTSLNWIQEGHEIRWKADTFFFFFFTFDRRNGKFIKEEAGRGSI